MLNSAPHNDTRPIHVMGKAIGPLCNLKCEYCFYLGKEELYPGETKWKMPLEILELYTKQFIDGQDGPEVTFAWQGGEPTLLGIEFFSNAVRLQKKYAGSKVVNNVFQTNGVLLDEDWCKFLAKNRFLVGVSIDGPRDLHDEYRKNKSGKGSFDEVIRGIEVLKAHNVEFNTLTVVHRDNSKFPSVVYRFLKDIGSRYLQFIPLVERVVAHSSSGDVRLAAPSTDGQTVVTEWSVDSIEYGTFLCTIFDEWVRKDVGSVFVQAFDVALESWIGMNQSLCVFKPTCGDAMVLEHNGDLYSCDHYVYPEYRLGNITSVPLKQAASSDRQRAFKSAKLTQLPGYCLKCPVRYACNGECPKHRFLSTSNGEKGLNYLCAGYRKFFHHIDIPMRYMVEELRHRRPPANVMQWMRGWDENARRRNEACFCDSGKKYKQCHGL